jgi:hypothetical protein
MYAEWESRTGFLLQKPACCVRWKRYRALKLGRARVVLDYMRHDFCRTTKTLRAFAAGINFFARSGSARRSSPG